MALRTGSWPRVGEQLVAAGGVDGVEQRGAAAGAQAIDAGFERVEVVGPVLGHGGRDVEAHHKGAVALRALSIVKQKLGRRLLLKLEARADGGAGVDDDAHAQRQIDLLVERVDAFRSAAGRQAARSR